MFLIIMVGVGVVVDVVDVVDVGAVGSCREVPLLVFLSY